MMPNACSQAVPSPCRDTTPTAWFFSRTLWLSLCPNATRSVRPVNPAGYFVHIFLTTLQTITDRGLALLKAPGHVFCCNVLQIQYRTGTYFPGRPRPETRRHDIEQA